MQLEWIDERNIFMDKMQEQVYKALMMPIVCDKHGGFGEKRKTEINVGENIIKTTQTYWPEYVEKRTKKLFRYKFLPDCDMSDFACEFYEIIYRDIFNGLKVVSDTDGNVINKQFAGDTMTTVSLLPKLTNQYHCLANFWLLPMELGRTSQTKWCKTFKDSNVKDFMDRFLLLVKYNFETLYKARFIHSSDGNIINAYTIVKKNNSLNKKSKLNV